MGGKVVNEDLGKVILTLAFEGLSMMKERTGRTSMKRQKYVLGDNKKFNLAGIHVWEPWEIMSEG